MRSSVPASLATHRWRHLAALSAAVVALSMIAVPSAFAGKPESSPSVDSPLTFAAGTVCVDPIGFANTTLKGKDSLFDPKRDGAQRWTSRGMGVSLVTDLATGATYSMKGGYRFSMTTAADGSVRVDGSGTDLIAWYFPGDVSDLGPGLWDINGHLTEWYAPDGSFIRAAFSGHATDICAALRA